MHAASNGHDEIVKVLLERKAKANVGFDEQTTSAIELAEARGHSKVVALLEPSRLPTLASLLCSIEGGDEHKALRTWMERGGSPSYRFVARTSDGRVRMPLLVYAAMYGRKDSVETLLKMDACVDAPIVADRDDAPSDGMTALMYACKDNHVDIVRLLLDSGADHKVRTSDGRSVMNIATADCAKAIRRFTAESKRRTQIEKAVESTIYSLKTALAAMQDAEAAAAAHTTSESTEGKQRELVLSAAKAKAHAQDALVAEVCSAEASMFGAVAKSPLVAPLLAQAKALLEDKSQAEKAKAAVAEEMPVATSDTRPHDDDATASDTLVMVVKSEDPRQDEDKKQGGDASEVGEETPSTSPQAVLEHAQLDETQKAMAALLAEQAEMQSRLVAQVERHEKAQREIDSVMAAVRKQIGEQLGQRPAQEAVGETSPQQHQQPPAPPHAPSPPSSHHSQQQHIMTSSYPSMLQPSMYASGMMPGMPMMAYEYGDGNATGAFQQQQHQWRIEQWLHSLEARIAPLESQGAQMLLQAQQQIRTVAMQVEQHKQLLDNVRSQQRHGLEVRLKALEAQVLKGKEQPKEQ